MGLTGQFFDMWSSTVFIVPRFFWYGEYDATVEKTVTRKNPGKFFLDSRFFCFGSVKMSENWPVRKNVGKFPWWMYTKMSEKNSEF